MGPKDISDGNELVQIGSLKCNETAEDCELFRFHKSYLHCFKFYGSPEDCTDYKNRT